MSVDFLASVASYPKPDDKIRSTSSKVLFLNDTFCFAIIFWMFRSLSRTASSLLLVSYLMFTWREVNFCVRVVQSCLQKLTVLGWIFLCQ